MTWIIQLYKAAEAAVVDPQDGNQYQLLDQLQTGCDIARMYHDTVKPAEKNRSEFINHLKYIATVVITWFPFSFFDSSFRMNTLSTIINHAVFDDVQRTELQELYKKKVRGYCEQGIVEAFVAFLERGSERSSNSSWGERQLANYLIDHINDISVINADLAVRCACECYELSHDTEAKQKDGGLLGIISEHTQDHTKPFQLDPQRVGKALENLMMSSIYHKDENAFSVARMAWLGFVRRLAYRHEHYPEEFSEQMQRKERVHADCKDTACNAITSLIYRVHAYPDLFRFLYVVRDCISEQFVRLATFDPNGVARVVEVAVNLFQHCALDRPEDNEPRKKYYTEVCGMFDDIGERLLATDLATNPKMTSEKNPFLEIMTLVLSPRRRINLLKKGLGRADTDKQQGRVKMAIRGALTVFTTLDYILREGDGPIGKSLKEEAVPLRREAMDRMFQSGVDVPNGTRTEVIDVCLKVASKEHLLTHMRDELLERVISYCEGLTEMTPLQAIVVFKKVGETAAQFGLKDMEEKVELAVSQITAPKPLLPEEVAAFESLQLALRGAPNFSG